MKITLACKDIPNIEFPEYYEAFSSDRILTMDWMYGTHLSEFTKTDFKPELGNALGQALWDFMCFNCIGLRKVHADPRRNFLVSESNNAHGGYRFWMY